MQRRMWFGSERPKNSAMRSQWRSPSATGGLRWGSLCERDGLPVGSILASAGAALAKLARGPKSKNRPAAFV
eukprot:276790-Heterocapsa_arctica.AAC.1